MCDGGAETTAAAPAPAQHTREPVQRVSPRSFSHDISQPLRISGLLVSRNSAVRAITVHKSIRAALQPVHTSCNEGSNLRRNSAIRNASGLCDRRVAFTL